MSDLKRGVYYGSLCVTSYPYALVIDGDVGSPEVVLQATAQQLQDGETVTSPRSSNRSMTWQILVEADTLTEQAEREAALIAETEKERNTWRVVAGDEVAPDTVYDVFKAASVKQVPHEEWEPQARIWELTIPASPFGRSAQPVVVTVPAPPADTPTIVSIDDCSSTTGWAGVCSPTPPSSPISASLTVEGGTAVRFSASWNGTGATLSLKRTGLSVAMGATPWLRFEAVDAPGPGVGRVPPMTYLINDILRTPDVVDGRIAWFDCTGMTINSVELIGTFTTASIGGASLLAYDLSRSSAPTDTGFTGRESARQVPVAGVQRAPASLSIASATSGLGDVLAFTRPAIDGLATPDLQAKRTSPGGPTGDVDTVSGVRTALENQHEFAIPADQVARGTHLLIVRIKTSSAVTRTLTWATRWKMGSTTSGDVESGSMSTALDADTWTIVPVAFLDMVPGDPGPAGSALIRLKANAATELDEAWLFDVESGRLSIVTCGEGSPAPGSVFSRLWLDAATLQRPAPSAWIGTEDDRSDQLFARQMEAFGAHEFKPPALSLFMVTTGATDAAATLTHFPRWHTWAAS